MSQVLTIRCTRKLIKRLDAEVPPERAIPTNRLGDWYANLLFTRRARLIICVSERSLLPVFVEARDPSSFISHFQERVLSVLRRMGAAWDVLHSEAREMDQIRIGATASRRVLGSLNDLASLARFTIEEHPEIELGALAIELANTPCAPLSYGTPQVGVLGAAAACVTIVRAAVDVGRECRRRSGGAPFVAMMQAANLGDGNYLAAASRLNGARVRAVFVE